LLFLILGYTITYMKWKQIPQTENLYECNSHGDIRRVEGVVDFGSQVRKVGGKILSPKTKKNGYLEVSLNFNGAAKSRYVHRLIAITWLSESPGRLQVNHKDGDKTNNQPNNLEFVSPSENMKHAYRKGLVKPRELKGSQHPRAKTNEKEVGRIRQDHSMHHSIKRLLLDYPHLTKPILTKIVYWESWKHVTML